MIVENQQKGDANIAATLITEAPWQYFNQGYYVLSAFDSVNTVLLNWLSP